MVKNIGNKDSNLQSKKHKNIIVFTLLLLTLLFNLIFFDPGFNMNNTSVNAYRLNILKNTIESKFGISNVSIKSEIRDKDGITRFKSVGIDPTPNNINTKLKNNLIVSGYIKYSLFESSAYLGDDIIQDIQYNYPEITDYNNIIVRIRTGYNAGLYKYYIAQEIEFDITDYIFNTYGK
jgi:hypothetical protein